MSNTFFTSDTHFSHANIILHCDRPWLQEGDTVPCERRGRTWANSDIKKQRAAEMDEVLIENWNSVITPDDTVWFLGDFMMSTSIPKIEEMLSKLNGTKHLIIGNHDPKMSKCKQVEGWSSVEKSVIIEVGGCSVLMEHRKVFPFMTDWMFHGHSHRVLNIISGQGRRAIDIGVDGNKYMPYSEEDIIELMLANS